MMQPIVPDAVLDVTRELCPMTFVRTRLALDALMSGQILLVRLAGAEPAENVPRTAALQGHVVLAQTPVGGEVCEVFLRRK